MRNWASPTASCCSPTAACSHVRPARRTGASGPSTADANSTSVTTPASATSAESKLPFQRVKSLGELDSLLTQAGQQGQRVMLDFYADWCVACKELETLTFSQPLVQQRLSSVKLLQVDVTANNSADRELLKRYGLYGPPGVLFFNPAKGENATHKVIGFQDATAFQSSLDLALTP